YGPSGHPAHPGSGCADPVDARPSSPSALRGLRSAALHLRFGWASIDLLTVYGDFLAALGALLRGRRETVDHTDITEGVMATNAATLADLALARARLDDRASLGDLFLDRRARAYTSPGLGLRAARRRTGTADPRATHHRPSLSRPTLCHDSPSDDSVVKLEQLLLKMPASKRRHHTAFALERIPVFPGGRLAQLPDHAMTGQETRLIVDEIEVIVEHLARFIA